MKILSTNYFSTNFPESSKKNISRENIIESLISTLNSNDIILLTGEQEIGKTTFLGEFASKHARNSISCFVKPINEFSTNLENILYDLILQINFIITNEEIKEEISPSLTLLQQYLSKLSRHKRNETYFIILDGFEEIDAKRSYQFASLFEVLPFGLKNFKFIISEKDNFIHKEFLKDYSSLKIYPYQFMKFGFDEAVRYLDEVTLEKHQIAEILKITDSLPGRIKVIIDAYKEGKINFDEIDSISSFNELMEKHWEKIDSDNSDILTLLALIAFEQKNTISSLSEILGKKLEDCQQLIIDVPFLKVIDTTVEFDSPTFEKFIKNKLHYLKNIVGELVLKYLMDNHDNVDSIIELPRRYDQAKKYENVLRFMTQENFKTIIENKESLSFLEEQTLHGINAAKELRNPIALFSLTLQKSCISEVKKTYVWKSEIEAKIELKDFNSAFDLANQSVLKEEKFKLIVLIARKKKEKGLQNDQSTLDYIEALYSQIEVGKYFDEDETIEIASDLIFTFPNLAIDLIDSLPSNSLGNQSDLGFARLAMLMRNNKDKVLENNETLDKINSRIKSPTIRNFTSAFDYLFNDETVSTFISKCKSLVTNTEKLQIVRIYLSENPKAKEIELVIDFALDILLLASKEISISSTILKEISNPLKNVENVDKIIPLINKFHSLKQIAREKGPTVNNIRFLLNLAIVDVIYNSEKGTNDLYELYLEIDKLIDKGIKTECLSIFYASLFILYKEKDIYQYFDLEKDILQEVHKNFDDLIEDVGQHLSMAEPVLSEISFVNPLESIKFCKKLNTRPRRDNAYLICLSSYLKNDYEEIDCEVLELFYKPILDVKTKNQVVSLVLNRFVGNNSNIKIEFLKEYISKISSFFNNIDKCYSYIDAISILYKQIKEDEFTKKFIEEIKLYLNDLDDRYQKIEFGFMIAATLMDFNKTEAIFFHDLAENEKKILELDSPVTLTLYYNSVRLCIKSLEGVVSAGFDSEDQINTLIEYINFLPSITMQKSLIGEIVFVLHNNGKNDLTKKVYDKNILPFINSLLKSKTGFSGSEIFDIISELCPITYIYQRDTLNLVIESLPTSYRDFCYDAICGFIIFKGAAEDVINENQIKVSLDEIISLLELLTMMKTDYLINSRLVQIKSGIKNAGLPKDSLVIISSKFESIMNSKFPDSNNIKHEGYICLTKAYILSINNSNKEEQWHDVIKLVDKIPNKSDRAYVKAVIASIIPNRLSNLKTTLFTSSIDEIDEIPFYTERVTRLSDIKNYMKGFNLPLCKNSVKKALSQSLIEDNGSLYETQQSLIDFAYEISEEFAEELIQGIDNDPARKSLSQKLKEHTDSLSLRNKVANEKYNGDEINGKALAEICAYLTPQLKANKMASKHLLQTFDWLLSAYKLPISETYPVYICFIQNLNSRFGKDYKKSYTLEIFNECVKNLQLIRVLSVKSSGKVQVTSNFSNSSSEDFISVQIGEREKAVDFIKKWVIEEVVDYVKICDPYFTFEDLELVKEIFLIKPEVTFTILGQFQSNGQDINARRFYDKWDEICKQNPPKIHIVMVGLQRGGADKSIISPNHDRWYITFNSGLTIGTSFNSLGNKNSSIQVMSANASREIEQNIIDKYVRREHTFAGDEKLLYDQCFIE